MANDFITSNHNSNNKTNFFLLTINENLIHSKNELKFTNLLSKK